MRFVVGVTLYNPCKEQIENIVDIGCCFEKVLLFDNSEPEYQRPEYPSSEKYVVLSYGENLGLSKAFNDIVDLCNDYDFLCTMDQDSKFFKEDIKRIKEYIEKSDVHNIGIIAPYVDYGHGKHELMDTVEIMPWVITSGSFVNLNVIRKYNLRYDENFFIDKFEIDMCEQIKRTGHLILMYQNSVLHQELGERSGHRHPNHSPLRHYYLFRNRLYFNNKWYSGFHGLVLNLLQTMRHLFLIVLYEKDKAKKLWSFFDAYIDYSHNKLGKKS